MGRSGASNGSEGVPPWRRGSGGRDATMELSGVADRSERLGSGSGRRNEVSRGRGVRWLPAPLVGEGPVRGETVVGRNAQAGAAAVLGDLANDRRCHKRLRGAAGARRVAGGLALRVGELGLSGR